jgi:hypothetical protein
MRDDADGGWEQRLDSLLGELQQLLKAPEVGLGLGARGVNTSIALLAAQGLQAYVHGNKAQAVDDLATAAEELGARLELARKQSQGLS